MSSSSSSTIDPHHEQSDLSSVVTTLVVFAMISLSLYFFLLKPILHVGDQNRPVTHNRGAAATRRGDIQQQQARPYDSPAIHQVYDSEVLSLLAGSTRYPPHVSPASASQAGLGGASVLVDGLVRFRHGRAASYEQPDDIAKNRRERARVLARLFALNNGSDASSSPAPPPSRGSTVVVSIPLQYVDCPKLRRVLFLLATFYNLFVMLSVDNNKVSADEMSSIVSKLRGDQNELPTEVLPDHRIVAAQSVTGRVAFVRQLARVEFVLDFEPEVRTQLSRFGFRVFVLENDGGADGIYSPLGKSLLP